MAIRLELMWLTMTTLAALVLVTATDGQVVYAEFARNLLQFAGSLNNTSIASLNQLRASLAADMAFFVAYGLLLRQSLCFAHQQRWTPLARHAAVAAMLSSLTFFFDRYRIPLVTVLIVLTAVTGSTARTDYVVETGPEKARYQLATPSDVLGRFQDR
jgi:hypothetical protein